ncbi:MAG: TorF family putative porin, partial [Thiohalorhabdaceae bacterium]
INASRFAPFVSAAVLLTGTGAAQAGLTGNVGVTNNYIWRGFTQTNDMPAVSGGLDYSHSSGIYVGTWISNVDFSDPKEFTMPLSSRLDNELTENKIERLKSADAIARQEDERVTQVRVDYSEKNRSIAVVDRDGWIRVEPQQYLQF